MSLGIKGIFISLRWPRTVCLSNEDTSLYPPPCVYGNEQFQIKGSKLYRGWRRGGETGVNFIPLSSSPARTRKPDKQLGVGSSETVQPCTKPPPPGRDCVVAACSAGRIDPPFLPPSFPPSFRVIKGKFPTAITLLSFLPPPLSDCIKVGSRDSPTVVPRRLSSSALGRQRRQIAYFFVRFGEFRTTGQGVHEGWIEWGRGGKGEKGNFPATTA